MFPFIWVAVTHEIPFEVGVGEGVAVGNNVGLGVGNGVAVGA